MPISRRCLAILITLVAVCTVFGDEAPQNADRWYLFFNDVPDVPQQSGLRHFNAESYTEYQKLTYRIVSGPEHGTVELASTYPSVLEGVFHYVPEPGFEGVDSFTWCSNDGVQDGNIATAHLVVRSCGAGPGIQELIKIVIDPQTRDAIPVHVQRLQRDLENDGYEVEVQEFTGSCHDLWLELQSTYQRFWTDGTRFNGAILIGDIPDSSDGYDKVYMYLDRFRSDRGLSFVEYPEIWVSRYDSTNPRQLENALDANHYYRTQQARIPLTAWYTNSGEFGDSFLYPERVAGVWPEVELYQLSGSVGDLLVPMAHGGSYVHRHNHNEPNVGMGPHHIHHAWITGCSATRKGDRGPDNYQFSYGGHNVTSMGASEEMTTSYDLSRLLGEDSLCATGLLRGESWGTLMVMGLVADLHSGSAPFTHFYGDWSLPLIREWQGGIGNTMPQLDSYALSPANPTVGEVVTITAAASDSDAADSDSPFLEDELRFDFFDRNVDYGRRRPSLHDFHASAPATTTMTWTFDRAHRYRTRVEVMDEWRARHFLEKDVCVAPRDDQPLYIDCGEGAKYADHGLDHRIGDRLWLHDQPYATGTWGWSCGKTDDANRNVTVAGTDEQAIYRSARLVRKADKPLTYRVPMPAGDYIVRIGFADLWSSAAGQRVLDVAIEGSAVATALDVYAVAGKDTAHVIQHELTTTDDEITIVFTKHPDATADPGVNAIEIIPVGSAVNSAPSVQLADPDAARDLVLGQSLALSAEAEDGDGAVTWTACFANGTQVCVADGASVSASWTPTAIGRYEIEAVAMDDSGATGRSTTQTITVLLPAAPADRILAISVLDSSAVDLGVPAICDDDIAGEQLTPAEFTGLVRTIKHVIRFLPPPEGIQ